MPRGWDFFFLGRLFRRGRIGRQGLARLKLPLFEWRVLDFGLKQQLLADMGVIGGGAISRHGGDS